MKNLRKLVIASFMLVIAFVAVVSSTYAWFTGNADGAVNDITLQVVDANKSLLISRDEGATWGRYVSYDFKGKYTPVTIETKTANTINFHELKTDDNLLPYYDAAVLLDETVHTPVNKGYVKLDLYFQVEASKDNLSNTKISFDVVNLHAYAADSESETGYSTTADENIYAKRSFRLAFTDGKTVDKIAQVSRGENDGAYGEGTQFRANNAWMAIYANNSNAALKVANAAYTEQTARGGFVEPVMSDGENPTITKYKLKSAYDDAAYNSANMVDIDNGEDAFEYEIESFYSDKACTTAISAANLATTTVAYAHVVIYVWMEGWDGNCENVASGCYFMFGLDIEVQ